MRHLLLPCPEGSRDFSLRDCFKGEVERSWVAGDFLGLAQRFGSGDDVPDSSLLRGQEGTPGDSCGIWNVALTLQLFRLWVKLPDGWGTLLWGRSSEFQMLTLLDLIRFGQKPCGLGEDPLTPVGTCQSGFS